MRRDVELAEGRAFVLGDDSKSIGINSHRSGIIRALGRKFGGGYLRVVKMGVAYPNLFSDTIFDDQVNNAAEEDAELLK